MFLGEQSGQEDAVAGDEKMDLALGEVHFCFFRKQRDELQKNSIGKQRQLK